MGLGRWSGRVPAWQPYTGHHASKLVLTCHDRAAIVQPRLRRTWRRNHSSAEGLPRQWMPRGVLDLSALRQGTVLLRPRVPRPGATPAEAQRQLPAPAQPRGPTGSSRPATRISAPPRASLRDGSRFPSDHFSGTMRMWDLRIALDKPKLAISAAHPILVLHPLRAEWPFCRSVPTITTIQ